MGDPSSAASGAGTDRASAQDGSAPRARGDLVHLGGGLVLLGDRMPVARASARPLSAANDGMERFPGVEPELCVRSHAGCAPGLDAGERRPVRVSQREGDRQPDREDERERRARGYDAEKKINGRKLYPAVVAGGSPIVIHLHRADIRDRDGAVAVLLDALRCPHPGGHLRGRRLRRPEAAAGAGGARQWRACWRSSENRRTANGFAVLPKRWVVERTFAWMGRYRRLSKDCERNIDSSLAWAQLTACQIRMRRAARAAFTEQ